MKGTKYPVEHSKETMFNKPLKTNTTLSEMEICRCYAGTDLHLMEGAVQFSSALSKGISTSCKMMNLN
jgi:hypothetical protein